jgi:hypothetical protein
LFGARNNIETTREGDSLEPNHGDDREATVATPFIVRVRVSTEVLISKSPVFQAMLSNGRMGESLTFNSNQPLEIPLPDDNAEAFLIILNILHDNPAAIPDQVDLKQLIELANLADKYSCEAAVHNCVNEWIGSHGDSIPVSSTNELLPWIWISWVFRLSKFFRNLTAVAQKEATGPIDKHNPYSVPIPEFITGKCFEILKASSLMIY